MKRENLLFVAAALLFVGAVLVVFLGPAVRERIQDPAAPPAGQPATTDDPTAALPRPEPPPFDISSLPPSPLNALLEPDITRADRLRVVGGVFLDYYSVFKALPTGTQEEIYDPFTGSNPRNITYYPKDHPAVNGSGIPLNAEGEPIFIHIISASGGIFELRDPGPDRAPFTEDDLVLLHPMTEGGESYGNL